MTDPQDLRRRADALLELHDEGRLEDALDAATALAADATDALWSSASDGPRATAPGDTHPLRHPREGADPVARESLFLARFERARILTELGDLEAAAAAYADAAETPADLDDADQRHEIAMALLNRGICLDAVGDHDAAIGAYDALISRFREAADPVTADQVIRGRVNRAAALLAVDRVGEALTAADVLARSLDAADVLEAEQLAMTVRIRAAALRALDRDAEAADALLEVEPCSDEDPAARSQVVAAYRDRAEVLLDLGRRPEALASLDAALARVRGETDPLVIQIVEEVRDVREHLVDAGPSEGPDAARGGRGDDRPA